MEKSETDIFQSTLRDWAIVNHPEIYKATENPEAVFAKINSRLTIALFGRAKDDPRFNAETGAFSDGHRLITSPIKAFKDGEYYTVDTIYTLDESEKNPEFCMWCEVNQYKEGDLILRHICECCGEELTTSSEEANAKGWDYPPKMGSFKIVSPRTCGACRIQDTLWWEITQNKTPPDQLSERQQQTLKRILTEPESIMP